MASYLPEVNKAGSNEGIGTSPDTGRSTASGGEARATVVVVLVDLRVGRTRRMEMIEPSQKKKELKERMNGSTEL